MKTYLNQLTSLLIIFIILLMVSCAQEESESTTYSNILIGNWIADVDKTIDNMKKSTSFISQDENKKQFTLDIMNAMLPDMKYTFLDNGNVEHNSPIINNPSYIKTIWVQENNKMNMTLITEGYEIISNIEFINSDNIKMINSKNNDEITYLIRLK